MPCIFMDVANAVFRARCKTFRCFAAFCVKRQHCIANESCQERYSVSVCFLLGRNMEKFERHLETLQPTWQAVLCHCDVALWDA